MRVVPDRVLAFRETYRRSQIAPGYSGMLHFWFTTTVALSVVGYALLHLRDVRPVEWLAVPLSFLTANLVEYLAHKNPMHRPIKLLGLLYKRHTLEHHRFFTHEAMGAETTRDFHIVLFPPVMILFFIGGIAAPLGAILYRIASPNVACFFVAIAIGYYLTYEWLHFSYHVKEDSWIARIGIVRNLRRLHTVHHDPALMNRHNFNITFPICDAIFGTQYRGPKGTEIAD